MRKCNFCRLEAVKEEARKTNYVVVITDYPIEPGFPDGKDVHMHPLPAREPEKRLFFCFWAASIPDECEC
jgi:hypothetical protein